MVSQFQIADRYEILEPLGEGGMGIVYRALDVKTRGYVAVKTMRDTSEPAAVELFAREWRILATLSHPNIVDIRDVGEIEENGVSKPFFVMPLLTGQTLGGILQSSSPRLTEERVVDIMGQVCRGLHAAHERGLIHRDIKPSNIFVMDDDTVKIIDFGIAHLAGSSAVTSLRGTWQYMSPEQVDFKPASALSDVFSLGVVCYEVLTGQRPFARKTPTETAEAVRRQIPPPISEVNPAVSQLVSMVVHKAMAKQPIHRFASAREFGETLQKAHLNQPLERFDRAKIQPRIERAKKAFAEGDYAFSSEILTEVESEGHIDREITLLRVQIEQASRRKKVRQLIEGAKARVEQDEIPLALEKLQELLEIDSGNAEALAIRAAIERQRNERQIESWMSLARRHMEQHDFAAARQALNEVLRARPSDGVALDLLNETGRREQDSLRIRAEKEQLYGSAVESYQNGEISGALSRLERILELGRQTPDAAVPDRDAIYQSFYNQVRSDRDAIHSAYDECRRQFAENNFGRALEVCEEQLAKYPGDALLQALKLEAVERQRLELSAYIAEIGKRIDAEPDLDRKVGILKEACDRYPAEQQFQQLLKLTRERRDLILSIVAKARQYEERRQFAEAIGQWDILRSIYPKFPAIDFEVGQLRRRREEQSKDEARARLIEQIDRALEAGEYGRAKDLAAQALREYPDDQEAAALERLAAQGLERTLEARRLHAGAQALVADGKFDQAAAMLRQASELNSKDAPIRDSLVHVLLEQARVELDADWRRAEPLVQEAAGLDGALTEVRHLRSLVGESKRKEFVLQCVSEAREQQAAGNLEASLRKIDRGLAMYPGEARLLQLQAMLQHSLEDAHRRLERNPIEAGRAAVEAPVAAPPEPLPATPANNAPASPAISPHVNALDAGGSLGVLAQAVAAHAPAAPSHAGGPGGFASPPVSIAAGRPLSRFQILILALSLAIAGAAMVFSALRAPTRKRSPAPPAPSKIAVRIHAEPADAAVAVNGSSRSGVVELDPRQSYRVVVSRLGFQTSIQDGLRPAPAWNFQLEPELVRLRIAAGEKSGFAAIDGREIGALQEGSLSDTEWAPDAQEHTLSIETPRGRLWAFTFHAEPAQQPTVAPLKTKDLIVVAGFGRSAAVYSGTPGLRCGISGRELRSIPPEGLHFDNLPPQSELTFDSKNVPRMPLESGNAPFLRAVFKPDPNLGSLNLSTNALNARLFVGTVEIRSATPGRWSIERRPGKYRLKLSADGYEDLDEDVEFTAGATVQRRLEMRPRLAVAALLVQGGTPAAEVWLDGTRIGVLDASGSLRHEGVPPGLHRLGFRKEFFEPAPAIARVFQAGQTVSVASNDSRLKEFGALAFQISPPEAQIVYHRAEQRDGHTARPGDTARVPEGRYSVTAQADGYAARTLNDIVVVAGKAAAVDLKLVRIPKKADLKPPPPPSVPSLFEWPNRLERVGAWWRGAGSGFVFMRPEIRHVTLTFANPGKGLFGRSKKVEWVAGYVSEKERVEYELDGTKLVRRAFLNGSEGKIKRVAHQLGAESESYTISLSVESGRIVVSAGDAVLDTFETGAENPSPGSIGVKANLLFTAAR